MSDASNLAARLQALAPTNGMLIDNVTHGLLDESDPALLASLDVKNTRVRIEDAKGQLVPVSAWIVEEVEARAVASGHAH